MRILVIGLSRELPLGPADAMELADHLVKRAAAVQADGNTPDPLPLIGARGAAIPAVPHPRCCRGGPATCRACVSPVPGLACHAVVTVRLTQHLEQSQPLLPFPSCCPGRGLGQTREPGHLWFQMWKF